MILSVQAGNEVTQQCDKCGTTITFVVTRTGEGLRYLEEFAEFENFKLGDCPECTCFEILNMNLIYDEYEISDRIPEEEWTSRSLVKNIKRYLNNETATIETTIPDKKPYIITRT